VVKKFKKIIDINNAKLGETERVMRFALIDYEWTVATGELTPTLKLKRPFIMQKFEEKIDKLFA